MNSFSRSLFAFTLVSSAPFLHAEDDDHTTVLDDLVVTTTRFNQTLFELVQPATVLKDEDLAFELQPTLGETLAREPGVSSTAFGPGASRPVIRGLGSDRVRILQNGTSVLDVSNVSPDHAVAADPLTIRSVEVVRGPATLLYGPNTIGGVVNVIDDRIPRERFEGTWPQGKFETAAGSVDDLFSQSGTLTFGHGPLVFHLDGFNRETDDIHIPGFARSERLRALSPLPPGEIEPYGVLPNSDTHSKGAGLGGSYVWDQGYAGLSYSGIDSHYGTVAEPDVTIGLRQRRWDFQGAFFQPSSAIKEINYKLGWSDYAHTEFEGTAPGTEFEIQGFDARAELIHEKLGPFEGAVGFESQHNTFSALGDEAFLPEVETNVNSAFFFEELPVADKVRLQFGARFDHQTNDSETDANFGPGRSLDFDAFSLSSGIVYNPVENYAVAFSAAYTQRPPTYVELFANGPHVATGTFEIGDPTLGTEDALSLDLSLRKNAGFVTGSASVFHYRFRDFISLQPTGAVDPVDLLPIFAYEPIGANFTGGEIEATFHLLEPATAAATKPSADPKAPAAAVATQDQRLDLILRADYVQAEDRKTGEDLPQIPPFRAGATLDWHLGNFGARLEGQYAAHQSRHANHELPTDGYFLVNAGLTYDLKLGGTTTTFYLKGTNLTDEEARQHTSLLKDIAPMAGRGVIAGLRTEF
jgi:iron complex outermembrane receptor protein